MLEVSINIFSLAKRVKKEQSSKWGFARLDTGPHACRTRRPGRTVASGYGYLHNYISYGYRAGAAAGVNFGSRGQTKAPTWPPLDAVAVVLIGIDRFALFTFHVTTAAPIVTVVK